MPYKPPVYRPSHQRGTQPQRDTNRRLYDSRRGSSSSRGYRLNQWISIHGDTWVPVEAWDACPRIKAEELLNQECFVGMDLATTTDLCAVSLVFPRPEGRVAVLQLYWAPEEAATRRERENRTRLTTWAMSGPPGSDRKWIEMTEGNSTSFGRIRYRMNELNKIYKVRAVLIDQREASHISEELEQDGFTIVRYPQGFEAMSHPTKELEKRILDGKVEHEGCPVTRWMFGNVIVTTNDTLQYRPSKKRSRDKIDGIVAMIMGLQGVLDPPPGPEKSVYERRGVLVF